MRSFGLALIAAALVCSAPALAQEEDDEVEADTERPVDAPPPPRPAGQLPPVGTPNPSGPTDPPSKTPAKAQRALTSKTNPAYNTLPQQPWRQSISHPEDDRGRAGFDLKHFLIELRFGPYLPHVDDEFGGAATPYANYFGSSPKFYFGLELDWLPARLPYVGSLGVAYGWGTVGASTKAKTATGDAGSDTTLRIFPMYAALVLRADGLLRYAHFPLVPYVKAGLGIGMWKASGPSGVSSAQGFNGKGTSTGLHLGVGGALALNGFDRHTAMAMKEETGIRYAYLWGEWMWNNLDGFGSATAMRVGSNTGIVGLGIEF